MQWLVRQIECLRETLITSGHDVYVFGCLFFFYHNPWSLGHFDWLSWNVLASSSVPLSFFSCKGFWEDGLNIIRQGLFITATNLLSILVEFNVVMYLVGVLLEGYYSLILDGAAESGLLSWHSMM